MQTEESEEQATGTGMLMLTSENNSLTVGELELTELNLLLMDLDHVNNAFEYRHLSSSREDYIVRLGTTRHTANRVYMNYKNFV